MKRIKLKALSVAIVVSLSLGSIQALANTSTDIRKDIAETKRSTFKKRELNVALTATKLQNVRSAIQNYYLQNNSFPATLAVLTASGLYGGNYSTPYGNIAGAVNANGMNLSVPVPAGGGQVVIAKLIAGSVGATLNGAQNAFTLSVGAPSNAVIVQSMLSRISDPANPNNNQMMQDFNVNDFDVQNANTITAKTLLISQDATLTGNVTVVNNGAGNAAFTIKGKSKFDGEVQIEGGANVNSNNGTSALNISRLGSVKESISLSVTDRSANFTYTEDTSSEGAGNYGEINFYLKGDNSATLVNPLKLTKNGIFSLGGQVWTSVNDGSGSTLDADTVDGINSTSLAQVDKSNNFISPNTFQGTTTFNGNVVTNAANTHNGTTTFNGNVVTNANNTHNGINTFGNVVRANGGIQINGKNVASSDGNSLYENNVALVNKYLEKTEKAADTDLFDGNDSTTFLSHRYELGSTENLNNITQTGLYHQAANVETSLARNYPVALAGKLEVVNNGYVYQTYHTYNNQGYYYRTKYGNTWYPWKMVVDSTWVKNTFASKSAANTFTGINTFTQQGKFNKGLAVSGDWVRISGTVGMYFSSYGGGWHMTDSTWLRSYASKSIYTGGVVRGDGGIQVDGKWITNSTGTTLYENNVALSSKYLGKTAKAADSNKLDNLDSTAFMRASRAYGYYGLAAPGGSASTWIRTTSVGLLPYSANSSVGASNLGTASWPFKEAHIKTVHSNVVKANTLYEGGVRLADKYQPKGSYSADVYTLIYNGGTYGLGSGDITLSKSFRTFDRILVIGMNDGRDWTASYSFTPEDYDRSLSANDKYNRVVLFGNRTSQWYGYFQTSKKFKYLHDADARIYRIYGVKEG